MDVRVASVADKAWGVLSTYFGLGAALLLVYNALICSFEWFVSSGLVQFPVLVTVVYNPCCLASLCVGMRLHGGSDACKIRGGLAGLAATLLVLLAAVRRAGGPGGAALHSRACPNACSHAGGQRHWA